MLRQGQVFKSRCNGNSDQRSRRNGKGYSIHPAGTRFPKWKAKNLDAQTEMSFFMFMGPSDFQLRNSYSAAKGVKRRFTPASLAT